MPLARVGQSEPINIVWRAFELRPEPVPPPPQEYLEQAWKSVEMLAARLGVEMTLPPIQPRTRLAHEAVAFAADADAAGPLADALFRAYWEDGRDIGDIDVLCDIGASVGLDVDALRAALESRAFKDVVDADIQRAGSLGITAVPTLIIGERTGIRGLPDEDRLRTAIREARTEG